MSRESSSATAQLTFQSLDEQDTERLGAWLADVLQGGDVVALNGELGAGKTRLVRAIAARLCPDAQQVSSPTFALIQRYEGRVPVYHFDAFRVADVNEFLDLGVEEIFAEGGVCLIEWADRVAAALPPGCLRIDIRATGAHSREFMLTGTDPWSSDIIHAIRDRVDART